MELLSEIKVVVKTSLSPESIQQKYTNMFPVSSQAEFEAVENEINSDTKGAMVNFSNTFNIIVIGHTKFRLHVSLLKSRYNPK